ncbi:MAG TPA: threonine/serine dehydratase [Candidatus Dormibacteraeota bacterium]|jgi:threonine dehydratase|nr:threonine/serine dehydratase [Candidatus Dormibacteraeota bacterium]
MAERRVVAGGGRADAGEGYLRRHAAEIEAASERIRPYVRRTPLLTTDLDDALRLKPECFQRTGSFKVRGAFNAVLQLRRRRPEVAGVIAVSSGNHAQAVALAARTVGIPAVILIPFDANPVKVAATRALGAEVIQEGVTFENREERCRQVMAERGLELVHPFDDWDIVHGQATAAREMLEDEPALGTIVVPVGGGGLLSGTALAAKAWDPGLRVIGVEPEVADDARRTLETGRIQRLERAPNTLADGVRPVAVGRRTFEVAVERGLVDAIVTVSEAEIVDGLRAAWLGCKLALEPTGALPLAAYLAGRVESDGRPVGLILSGGNADLGLVARLLPDR